MDARTQNAIAKAFQRQIRQHSTYRHQVKLVMETGVDASGVPLGENTTWSTGTPVIYEADVGQRSHPRMRLERGLQSGEKYGRATISAVAAGTTVDSLAETLSRYRRANATTRYRPQVLVDDEAVTLENVVTDPIAKVVVLEYVQQNATA